MIERLSVLVGVFLPLAWIGLVLATNPSSSYAATLVAGHNQASCQTTITHHTIQAAVDAASPGDTIQVCPGVYDEQVTIRKNDLEIRGAGATSSFLRPGSVYQNTTDLLIGSPVYAILLVDGSANVSIANLAVDGSAADSGARIGNCSGVHLYEGVYYRNSSGVLNSTHITRVQSSTACTFAIIAESANLSISNNVVDYYGKAGVSCFGQYTSCTITGNTVRGLGPVTNQDQAGIQIRAQAAGAISGNVITDHFFSGAQGVPQSSVGIFLFYAQPTSNPRLIRDNVFSRNQVDVQRSSSAEAFR